MNEFLFIVVLVLSLASFYSAFIRQDKKLSVICLILAVKAFVIWYAAGTGVNIHPLEMLSITGIIIAAIMVLIISGFDNTPGKSRLRFSVLLAVLVLLAVFASGCKNDPGQKPAVTGEFKLGYVPSKIISPAKDELYVASERGKVITAYFMSTQSTKTSIPSGYMPVDLLIVNNILYSANKSANTVTIHNLETGKGIDINSGGAYPCSLAVNQQKNRLYVANLGSNNVAVVDLSAPTITVVKKIPVGKWPSDLYLSPDNRYLYVCCKYTNTIQVIDAEKEQPVFTKVDTGISPSKMVAISKREIAIINEWEYAFNHQSTIIVFDRLNYNLEYDIMVEGGIFDAVLSKSKRYMYVTVPLKDKVLVVDLKKRETVFEMIFKDDTPRWLALSVDKRTLYVAAQHTGKIFTVALNGMM